MEKLNINIIKDLIINQKIRWTNHVMIRLLQRNISQRDVENALLNGEIIENYEIIHVVCGSNHEELWIVTAYYPDSTEWEIDKKTRKE